MAERPDARKNRPNGLIVNLWLQEKPKADVLVTIEFLEGTTVVRTLTSVATKAEPDEPAEPGDEAEDDEQTAPEPVAGVNRVVCDLRKSAAEELYSPELKTSQDSLNYLPKLDFQISSVGGMSDRADAKPTAAALARHKELQGQLEEILGRLDTALAQDLSALNKAVADAGIPPVVAVTGGPKR